MNSYNIIEIITIINDINLEYDGDIYYINETLKKYTQSVKLEIEKVIKEWDMNKKYANPYEFINTSYDSQTLAVCSYRPISRAFFKLVEIINHYKFNFPNKMNSFHLAEGPGGFIEALQYVRNNQSDTYYGMTLMTGNKDIPKWDKMSYFLSKNPNIIIEKGADHTGNLYSIENLEYVYGKYKHSMDFITADGGFDYSTDFNKQEECSINLIFSEICFAMALQKKGGSFVLKIFDTFSYCSIQLIYLLTYLYEDVCITKPLPSRPANSEKYIICNNFRMVSNLNVLLEQIFKNFSKIKTNKLTSIFNIPISNLFIDKIKEINSIYGQSQIENIISILNNIKDTTRYEKQEQLKKSYLGKCVKWCSKNNLPINSCYS
jgi:23S rRNA U2552 (ribose-2'-O)-methylase RlmE/FtsJ